MNLVELPYGSHFLSTVAQNNLHMQREEMQVTQPSSMPSSPITSPGAQSSTSFTMPNNMFTIDTGDPNWQATKPTVRERNAAMFNNELMSDISFVVGIDGKPCIYLSCSNVLRFPHRSRIGISR